MSLKPALRSLYLSQSGCELGTECTYHVYRPAQICQDFNQIKKITWNFSEAEHGKGAPDGVGAVHKRTADHMTLFGKDFGTYDQFCNTLIQTVGVTIKKVDIQEIIAKELLVPKNLKPFKGTLSVYQVLWDVTVPTTVLRHLSCFDCNADKKYIHGYDLGRLTNYSHGNNENIDPNYVTPLSKLGTRNQVEGIRQQNPNKQIVVLSDIKIGRTNSFKVGDYGEPKPSTFKF